NQDKHIKVKLEQNIDTLEFMSLNISTTDAYQNFNADYGVLVGRVIANNGIGIPNAKISIFIPLTDEDANNSDIYSIYPYNTPRDKNNEGKRYNLLPRVSQKDQNTGVIRPKQAFGSFPIKEEIVGNEPFLNVYKKYYKYTALTNNAGDYMIFGVPTGTQIVHLSVDTTDIGEYSMNPAAMVTSLGYSTNLFTDNNTKIKPSKDLLDLPNIETQEISVDIIPFWGDIENFEIGITRQDFRVRAELINTFVIFGSAYTDNANSMWSDKYNDSHEFANYYRISNNGVGDSDANVSIATKRDGKVTESIYYYPNKYSDIDIDNKVYGPDEMLLLDKSEYSVYKQNGDFVFIINSNRNKIITDDLGVKQPVPENYDGGVYTTFRGFVIFEITDEELGYSFEAREIIDDRHAYPFRYKFKFPQNSDEGKAFDTNNNDTITSTWGTYTSKTGAWRRETYDFKAGNIYSVARFHGTVKNSTKNENFKYDSTLTRFATTDDVNNLNNDPYWNTGIIIVDKDFDENNPTTQFPNNGVTDDDKLAFGSNWMNLSIHFPQVGWMKNSDAWNEAGGSGASSTPIGSNTNFTGWNNVKTHFYTDNEQQVAGDYVNTKWFARSDLHHTDFIKIDKATIKLMGELNRKGFTLDNVNYTLQDKIKNGDFRNGETSTNTYDGGKTDGDTDNTGNDNNYYFYKGQNDSDCIKFLISLGLV
nr:hypothetical protein [Bacteroidales bacterium]